MAESDTLSAISVQFVLSRSTIDNSKRVSNYHFHVQLSPLVQAQPFEPFVSLIQLMAQRQALSLTHYFEHIAKAPSRLRNLFIAWFEQRDDADIEPCNPDEYEYEQSEIRQMLYRLLSWVVEQQAEPIKILISHCQYLPVSSSLLINEFRARKENLLSIDLSATSQELHDWWPEAQIQRDLKHRFLVSSRLETGQITAQKTLQLNAEPIRKSKQIYWAGQLYCGDELLLLTFPSINAVVHEPLSKLENYSHTLWALTCVNRHDDANRTLSDLVQLQFSRFTWLQQAQAYQALFKHHMWFKRYSEAMLAASEYLAASLKENRALDADYALLLCFWSECLVGNFKYDSKRIEQLTAKLSQRNWKSLYHLVQHSLWFDQVNFSEDGETKYIRSQEALAYYLEDCNPLAISRAYHHLSVMFMRSNRIEEAGLYIELAVQFQQQMPLIERHYNALNGQCFYLVHAGKFSRALQSVEKAYVLVVEDGNFEQLCTTLFNAAYVAFFTNHYTQCIRIIDDIFSIMLLRGLTRTRFRSNYELKAMQAMCNLFRGDVELALAIFESAPVEDQTSLEGKFFVQLLALLSQKEVAGHASFELELHALITSMQFSEKNILLALLARKFAHQISLLEPGIWQSELADNTSQAFSCCEQNNFPACKEWFIPTYSQSENSHLQAQFEKFNAIKLARRELQIDLLKVENSLLKAALNFEGFARTCQSTAGLFAHFMEGLTKTIRVTYIHLKVQAVDEHLFDQRFGLSPRNPAQAHRFPISAPEINGHLLVSFDPITDVYQNELLDWVGHMVEQLLLNLDRLFDFKRSESLAYIDYLTGLSNRAALDRYFTDLKNRSVHSLIVGYVDLDNFKLLNDEFGHEVGDRYLKLFTEHLSSSIREQDRIFRVGGDEFVIILENVALAHAEQVARRFQHSFLEHLFSVEKSFSPAMRLGSSIGLVHLPGESVPKLGKLQILKLADQLMYQAKQSGVNCLCALQHVSEE